MAYKMNCKDCPYSRVYRTEDGAESKSAGHGIMTGHETEVGRMGALE